jgi:hypothetical protein
MPPRYTNVVRAMGLFLTLPEDRIPSGLRVTGSESTMVTLDKDDART